MSTLPPDCYVWVLDREVALATLDLVRAASQAARASVRQRPAALAHLRQVLSCLVATCEASTFPKTRTLTSGEINTYIDMREATRS